MSGGMKTDISGLESAIADYAAFTGKTATESITRAAQNLMYKAAAETPVAKARIIDGLTDPPAFVTAMVTKFKARAIFKASMKKGKAATRLARIAKVRDEYRAKWWAKIQKPPRARKYMASGYIKAGKALVAARKAVGMKRVPVPAGGAIRHPGIKANATVRQLMTSTQISWNANDKADDSMEKESIVFDALNRAIPAQVKDMTDYIASEMAKQGRKVSGVA